MFSINNTNSDNTVNRKNSHSQPSLDSGFNEVAEKSTKHTQVCFRLSPPVCIGGIGVDMELVVK